MSLKLKLTRWAKILLILQSMIKSWIFSQVTVSPTNSMKIAKRYLKSVKMFLTLKSLWEDFHIIRIIGWHTFPSYQRDGAVCHVQKLASPVSLKGHCTMCRTSESLVTREFQRTGSLRKDRSTWRCTAQPPRMKPLICPATRSLA